MLSPAIRRRTGNLLRRLTQLSFVLMVTLGSDGGCDILEPDDNGVQGTWIPFEAFFLEISNDGFDVPGENVQVRGMSIRFDQPYGGNVIGSYQIVEGGVGKPLQKHVGRFTYLGDDDKGGEVTITAFNESATGTVKMNTDGVFDEITVNQVLKIKKKDGTTKIVPIVNLRLRR